MNHHQRQPLGRSPRLTSSESLPGRYGTAMLLPLAAALIISLRPVFAESPFFIFLGAVALSAAHGGLAPAFASIALSAVLIRLLYIDPAGILYYRTDFAGMERMAGFVLVSLTLSSFVAALRRDRNSLRDSEERYRLLAETASDSILVIDEKGEILYANPVAERTFGSRTGELHGRNLASLLPGDGYREKLAEMRRQVDSRQKVVAVQLSGLHQSGEHLLIEMTLGPSTHRGRPLFTAILREITARDPGS